MRVLLGSGPVQRLQDYNARCHHLESEVQGPRHSATTGSSLGISCYISNSNEPTHSQLRLEFVLKMAYPTKSFQVAL